MEKRSWPGRGFATGQKADVAQERQLPQRLQAFHELLRSYPEHRMSATLIQIASPTRQEVDAYSQIRTQLELLCGSINGEFGELDWMPVRYLYRTMSRRRLPGLYRASRVGLVTPLRDGMNLVAKEYVLAQDPEDPGVLVLSRFAGAAEQMREALLVNPYDIPATAEVFERALRMPLAERVERHQALLRGVERNDVRWWLRRFLGALGGAVDVGDPPRENSTRSDSAGVPGTAQWAHGDR